MLSLVEMAKRPHHPWISFRPSEHPWRFRLGQLRREWSSNACDLLQLSRSAPDWEACREYLHHSVRLTPCHRRIEAWNPSSRRGCVRLLGRWDSASDRCPMQSRCHTWCHWVCSTPSWATGRWLWWCRSRGYGWDGLCGRASWRGRDASGVGSRLLLDSQGYSYQRARPWGKWLAGHSTKMTTVTHGKLCSHVVSRRSWYAFYCMWLPRAVCFFVSWLFLSIVLFDPSLFIWSSSFQTDRSFWFVRCSRSVVLSNLMFPS